MRCSICGDIRTQDGSIRHSPWCPNKWKFREDKSDAYKYTYVHYPPSPARWNDHKER
jgi:hypothetical protein